MHILGAMSGSSLDGIDLALLQLEWISKPDKLAWKLLQSQCIPLSDKMISYLSKAHTYDEAQLDQLDHAFCRELSSIICDFRSDSLKKIDFISSHGHTIYHYPQKKKTLQIGNGNRLSALIKLPVISDFRIEDLLLGGQGAPLAPIVDKYLFDGRDYYLNLGGIANITIANNWTAFDICPCNQILNHFAQKNGLAFDDQGKLARSGCVDPKLLEQLNEWSFYKMSPPKSLDNTALKNHFIPLIDKWKLSIPEILCTFCHHITQQIFKAIQQNSTGKSIRSQKILITGGGAYHTFLMELIESKLKSVGIEIDYATDEIIQFKEAMLMALMGFLKIENIPNCLSSATGASYDHVAGTIYVN